MSDSPSLNGVAPHRGFSTKAREMLLDKDEDPSVTKRRGKLSSKIGLDRTDSQATTSSKSSTQSIQSIPEPMNFDNIDDVAKRKAKMHKTLGELGKTRSVDQIRAIDRRLMRTFANDNILRLPSADSDLGDYPSTTKPLPKKSNKYEVALDEEE